MGKWLLRALTVLLATFSVWLLAELLLLNATILPALRGLVAAAYQGQAQPLINLIFRWVATDAYKTPLSLYQDKLTYAYSAGKIPVLVIVVGATVLLWLSSRPPEARLAIRNGHQRLAYVVFCLLLLALLVDAQLGTYSRFMGDDYCGAAALAARGVLGGTVYTYLTWTGRYSSAFFSGLALQYAPHLFPLYPAIILLTWFAVTTAALFQFPVGERRLARLCISALLSAALVFTTLRTSPHLAQSLYWFSPMPNLLPPLVLSAACVGLARYRLNHELATRSCLLWSLSATGLSFIAGGFFEAYAVLQVSAWVLLLLVAVITDKSRFRSNLVPLTAPFLVGSLAALAVLAAAPGNGVRIGAMGVHPTLVSTAAVALTSLLEFLTWSFFTWQPGLSLLALLLLSGLISGGYFGGRVQFTETRQFNRTALIMLPAATFLLLYSCFVPAAYGLGGPLPGRDQIIPAFVLVCGVACEGAIMGQLPGPERRRLKQLELRSLFYPVTACTLIIYLLTTAQATYTQLRRLPEFALYASRWDANEALIRAAIAEGADHVVIARQPENWAGMADREINNDPGNWINQCASQYYGIEITAEGPSSE